MSENPNEHRAGQYVAISEGPNVCFYDGETLLFMVPAPVANSQAARDSLARVYDEGRKDGKTDGKYETRREIREALGIDGIGV